MPRVNRVPMPQETWRNLEVSRTERYAMDHGAARAPSISLAVKNACRGCQGSENHVPRVEIASATVVKWLHLRHSTGFMPDVSFE